MKKQLKTYDFASRDKYKITGEKLSEYCHVIDEEVDNLHSEIPLKKSDILTVDLSSFRPQKKLNPKIWPHNLLNSRVRLRLMDIADDFLKTLEIDWVKPKDVILTGSLANYNWSKYSDFDLHILIDFKDVDERVNFVKDYFDSKKSLWNQKHENLKIYGFPVEIYVQDINELHTASGIYSLYKNKWLKTPEKDNIKAIQLDKFLIKEKSIRIMKEILNLEEKLENTNDEFEISEIAKKSKALFDKIKGIRKNALTNGNEMSPGNIIFKILRRTQFLDKLISIKNQTYDKINTIK